MSYTIDCANAMKQLDDSKGIGSISLSESDIEEACNVASGIVVAIANGMYRKGFRNNIAVDWCISCWCMACDPTFMAYKLENDGVLNKDSSANLRDRINVINDYKDAWLPDWTDYYLDSVEWESWADQTEHKMFSFHK